MTGPALPDAARAGVRRTLAPRTVCAATAELFASFAADRIARQAAHVALIDAEARRLGREVARYERTLSDAQARLERLLDRLDEACSVPLRLVPYATGVQVARAAFTGAMATAERRAS